MLITNDKRNTSSVGHHSVPVSDVTGSQQIRNAKTAEIVVLWIDWYPYHVARFRALCDHPRLGGLVSGLEMIGGTGVHKGLKFREEIPAELPVDTIFPNGDWSSLGQWEIARATWNRLSQVNPGTILVPGYYNLPALAAALWARLHRRRSVLMTESTENDHPRTWWRELFKRALIASLFSWAIAGGKAHRRYLQQLGFQGHRIGRFYDVVDNDFFWHRAQEQRVRHRAEELKLPNQYFLYVGRLAEEKSIRCLLEAYIQYRQSGGTFSLVVVGDGPEAVELQTFAESSTFSKDIHFEGLKASKELAPYYAFATCFVLPSKREPWGLVVNEAMAAGLPVIVSAACGCSEDLVLDGQNGYAFTPDSREELTDCLSKMDALGAIARNEMGLRSSAIVNEYSPRAWAEEVARVANI